MKKRSESLLEALILAQRSGETNSVSPTDQRRISETYEKTFAELSDIVSFYSQLSLSPKGKYVIRVCAGPCCFLQGGKGLLSFLTEYLGICIGETTADGLFTLESTGCIGLCDAAPAMMINDQTFGNVSVDGLKKIISTIRKKELC